MTDSPTTSCSFLVVFLCWFCILFPSVLVWFCNSSDGRKNKMGAVKNQYLNADRRIGWCMIFVCAREHLSSLTLSSRKWEANREMERLGAVTCDSMPTFLSALSLYLQSHQLASLDFFNKKTQSFAEFCFAALLVKHEVKIGSSKFVLKLKRMLRLRRGTCKWRSKLQVKQKAMHVLTSWTDVTHTPIILLYYVHASYRH